MSYYSNPGLIEVQMQVISEYANALIRFVASHKWGNTVDMAKKYRDLICKKMDRLVHEVNTNNMYLLLLPIKY